MQNSEVQHTVDAESEFDLGQTLRVHFSSQIQAPPLPGVCFTPSSVLTLPSNAHSFGPPLRIALPISQRKQKHRRERPQAPGAPSVHSSVLARRRPLSQSDRRAISARSAKARAPPVHRIPLASGSTRSRPSSIALGSLPSHLLGYLQ